MHIGEVARRTGLSVKTVRYYSDLGLVPEAERTTSGYRSYDGQALVRLEYVRTLRELGLDLATIRRVLERQVELPEIAAAHAEALGAQIRLLRVQRAALRALSHRATTRGTTLTPEEVDRMTRLAQATADERRRLIEDFLSSIFEGVNVTDEFAGMMRQGMPELPDDPTDAQIDAWIELAELIRDEGFRERLREMGRRSFNGGDSVGMGRETASLVVHQAGAAVAKGIDPKSHEGVLVSEELVRGFATAAGRAPDEAFRAELKAAVESGYEPRAEHYWQLIAVINGWPQQPSQLPTWKWFLDSLS